MQALNEEFYKSFSNLKPKKMSHFQLIEEIVLLDVEFEVNFEFGKFLKKNDFFLDKNACLGLMGTLMEKGMLEEKEIGYL